jgi:hypothetical protein
MTSVYDGLPGVRYVPRESPGSRRVIVPNVNAPSDDPEMIIAPRPVMRV